MVEQSLTFDEIFQFYQNSDQIILIRTDDKISTKINNTIVSIADFVRACSYFGQRHNSFLKFLAEAGSPHLTDDEYKNLSQIIARKIIVQLEKEQEIFFTPINN